MKQLKKSLQVAIAGVLTVASILPAFSGVASAAQITNRSVVIGSSAATVQTTYTFNFTVASGTAIKSASFTACTTASGACTTPSGFSISGSSIGAQPTGMGAASGWTANTATPGSLRILNAANATVPSGSQTVYFNAVTNPTATNSTYFFRIATFSDAAWTTGLDAGNVATSTAGIVTVTASVDETLTFTLGTSSVALGTLSTGTTATGTSTMTASTNATTGYNITVNGTTLTSGGNTITALAAAAPAATSSKQFGINLMQNTGSPTVGTGVTGGGSGTAQTGYNTANNYKFATGDIVAAANAPTNANTYTVSYIANIDPVTVPGSYSTDLNYIATANF